MNIEELNTCRHCGENVFKETETFVILAGGALVRRVVKSNPVKAFLSLKWRAPFSRGEGGMLKSVDIVDYSDDRQFDLRFCSSACLRNFLNSQVDALDGQIDEWYRDRLLVVLEQSGRSVAVDEWRRYFGGSISEAEEAIDKLSSDAT